MKLRRLARAEYWWQPLQLPRRAWRLLNGSYRRSRVTVRLPWDFPITVNPRESIGRSVLALNMLDLPVAESLWRLLDDGETAADVGANIGFMTSVLAARLQRGGTVWSFEPLPPLANVLRAHVERWQMQTHARLDVREIAVSDQNQPAELFTPPEWNLNQGTATLERPDSVLDSHRVTVACGRLDEIFADNPPPRVMKVDVEGSEARVFRGAGDLLKRGTIRDIVFEELKPVPSDSTQLLESCGYTLFRILRCFAGPVLAEPRAAAAAEVDPPSFLATRDPERARSRFAPRGWQTLTGR